MKENDFLDRLDAHRVSGVTPEQLGQEFIRQQMVGNNYRVSDNNVYWQFDRVPMYECRSHQQAVDLAAMLNRGGR